MTAISVPVLAPSGSPLETLRWRLGPASVEGALGVRIVAATPGHVELEVALAPLLGGHSEQSARGVAVQEAALAVLCDCGLGLAFMALRGDGDGGITLDLRVDAVEAVRPGAARLTLVADWLGSGEDHGCGRVEVFDDRGRLVGRATGTMVISPSLPFAERDPDGVVPRRLDLATLFDDLELTEGGARIPIRPETENTRGIVHGALLSAAALTISRAAGNGGRLLSFSTEFLRPVPADVGSVCATVTPVRRGRRFLSDRIELLLPDGRTAASVTTVFARD